MLKNTYRYVKYLDDGHVEWQCLECYAKVPHAGNYCSNCGTMFERRLVCRNHDTPRYEHENPNLNFYRKSGDVESFYINGWIFKNAKDVLEAARTRSISSMKKVEIHYGTRYKTKLVKVINEHVKELVKLKERTLEKGAIPFAAYGDLWYTMPNGELEFVATWDDYYEFFPEELVKNGR